VNTEKYTEIVAVARLMRVLCGMLDVICRRSRVINKCRNPTAGKTPMYLIWRTLHVNITILSQPKHSQASITRRFMYVFFQLGFVFNVQSSFCFSVTLCQFLCFCPLPVNGIGNIMFLCRLPVCLTLLAWDDASYKRLLLPGSTSLAVFVCLSVRSTSCVV